MFENLGKHFSSVEQISILPSNYMELSNNQTVPLLSFSSETISGMSFIVVLTLKQKLVLLMFFSELVESTTAERL